MQPGRGASSSSDSEGLQNGTGEPRLPDATELPLHSASRLLRLRQSGNPTGSRPRRSLILRSRPDWQPPPLFLSATPPPAVQPPRPWAQRSRPDRQPRDRAPASPPLHGGVQEPPAAHARPATPPPRRPCCLLQPKLPENTDDPAADPRGGEVLLGFKKMYDSTISHSRAHHKNDNDLILTGRDDHQALNGIVATASVCNHLEESTKQKMNREQALHPNIDAMMRLLPKFRVSTSSCCNWVWSELYNTNSHHAAGCCYRNHDNCCCNCHQPADQVCTIFCHRGQELPSCFFGGRH